MLKIAFHPLFVAPLPEGHRFPMEKYELLPQQLIRNGIVEESNFFEPEMVSEDLLYQVHDASYIQALERMELPRQAVRKLGLPLNPVMVEREKRIMEGTRMNAVYALEHGVSFNIAGGTHHAYRDSGEGFCLFNDIAIGAQFLLNEGMERVLVVDLDVHQGNGTAKIFENEHRVFTFSMHGDKNYPMKKEVSDLDVPLPDETNDTTYLNLLEHHLVNLIDQFQPQFIFYQAGVDALVSDKLGRLSLTMEGLKQRDEMVFATCKNGHIPVAVSMGGGYSPDIKIIVDAHYQTYEIASRLYF